MPVLSFVSMPGDSEQEFFADAMTEDIISGLSRFRSLFVIARNSTFGYNGHVACDAGEVVRLKDLGVRYIVEASVRRGGARIRVTVTSQGPQRPSMSCCRQNDAIMNWGSIWSVGDEVQRSV